MTPRLRLIALIVSCALMLNMIDATVLGTALPAISRDFGVSAVSMHMTMSIYLLMLAVFIPISGWIADRFGTKPVFIGALISFMLASIACALSQDLTQLLVARAFQGMAGALTLPVARLVLLRSAPRSAMVQAMIWVSVPALVGPVLGPPLGGFLVTYATWHWIFWINIPIGVVGVIMALIYFENFKADEQQRFDWIGFVVFGAGAVALVLSIESLLQFGPLAPLTLALAVGAMIAFTLYVVYAKRVSNPMLELDLLQIPVFRASVVGGTLFRMGTGAFPFLMPLMLQEGFGKSPLASGMLVVATALGALFMKIFATKTLARFGFRQVLIWNTVLVTLLMAMVVFFGPQTSAIAIFIVLFFNGFFRSLQFTAINSVGYSELDDAQMSRATSFSSMAQQLSLTMGVGVGAIFLYAFQSLRGGTELAPIDFSLAFAAISGIILLSIVEFARLDPGAGAEASQHQPATVGGAARPPSDSR
ncbi:MFS transporter [Pseudovibrio exalbescens]|uniref:MFS transporter n=1 Tax=Pseudovibrio exalbescens TaxID=197461 RepID=UPI0023670BF8|nr:MFS transporter [Pseudovibrio exalbescens]MDD7908940.1 MFS transporter [Pseudovibrio exalbescens]